MKKTYCSHFFFDQSNLDASDSNSLRSIAGIEISRVVDLKIDLNVRFFN